MGEAVGPEAVARVLDELDESDEEAPLPRSRRDRDGKQKREHDEIGGLTGSCRSERTPTRSFLGWKGF